jgi:hypothetical protein
MIMNQPINKSDFPYFCGKIISSATLLTSSNIQETISLFE